MIIIKEILEQKYRRKFEIKSTKRKDNK